MRCWVKSLWAAALGALSAGWTCIEALDEERKPVAGDAGFSIEQNRTVLRVRPEIVSWRVVRPPDVKKPNAVHVLLEVL